MADALERHLRIMDRRVLYETREGEQWVVVRASRSYPTHALDLWRAVTDPDRLRRWFMPISGDLRVGGRYQLQGNAGGTILECVEPELFRVTWEFGGGVSWVTVRFTPEGDATRLELEHESPLMPGFTDRRRRWRSVYWATCTGTVGRGPMIAMSPRSTLTRLGSSSIDVRRRNAPTRVMRGSPSSTARPDPIRSAPVTMVRSLMRSNSRPCSPTRRWR